MLRADVLLVSPCRRPTFNLAAEEHLLTHRGDTVLFLYVNTPAVVLGHHQSLLAEVDQAFCHTHHIPVVRRLSGGGTVYHDEGNLNVCLMGNREQGRYPLDLGITPLLQAALQTLGLPVTMGERKDLWLEGRKIAGTAAHINRTRYLHHTTLLYDADLSTLEASLKAHRPDYDPQKGSSIPSVPSQVTNIKAYLDAHHRPSPQATVFFAQLSAALLQQSQLTAFTDLTPDDLSAICHLENTRYTQPAWIERR